MGNCQNSFFSNYNPRSLAFNCIIGISLKLTLYSDNRRVRISKILFFNIFCRMSDLVIFALENYFLILYEWKLKILGLLIKRFY